MLFMVRVIASTPLPISLKKKMEKILKCKEKLPRPLTGHFFKKMKGRSQFNAPHFDSRNSLKIYITVLAILCVFAMTYFLSSFIIRDVLKIRVSCTAFIYTLRRGYICNFNRKLFYRLEITEVRNFSTIKFLSEVIVPVENHRKIGQNHYFQLVENYFD